LGLPFVYFPSQVKPYSSDIAAGLLVLLLGLRVWRKPAGDRGALALGLAGAAIPWFSYPSVFTLAGVGAALAALALSQREPEFGRRTLVTVSVWAAGALLAIVAARRGMTPADGAFMQRYWAAGFAPVPPHSLHDVLWPWKQ